MVRSLMEVLPHSTGFKCIFQGWGCKYKINGSFRVILRQCDSPGGQEQVKEMCIEERNKIFSKGVSGCPFSSPHGVGKVEIPKQKMVGRGVKKRVVKQRKYIRGVRGSREKIRKI